MTVQRYHREINSAKLAAPRGHFSQAVQAKGTVYVAGLLAFDADGDLVGADDVGKQAARIFDILELILAEAGHTLENVVRLTTYLTDLEKRGPVNQIRAARFGALKPASTLIEVSGLAAVGAIIEIDAISAGPSEGE